MLMQGYDDQTRLIVCDLLTWILQKEPKNRPQSCEEMLQHPFFATGVKSLELLVEGLHLSRMHIASALGNDGEVQSILAKVDSLDSRLDTELREIRAACVTAMQMAEDSRAARVGVEGSVEGWVI